MYRDPRYDNSALGKLRRLLCSCLDPNTRIHVRRRRFSHQKRALLLMAAIGALLLWNSGNEPEPPTMLRGGGLAGSILVVGGFGFVGAALIEQALDLDYKVFVMDSSAAYRTAQPRSPLIKYIDSDTVPHDARAGPYADAMELVPNGVDHVIYAAGVQDNGERHSIWDSAEGVRHVLEWCGDRRVSDFVLLSSMDVCKLSTKQSEELQVEACVSPAEVLLKHKRVSTLTAPARKALEAELVMEDLCANDSDDVDEAMWDVKCGVLRLSEPYGDGIEDGPLAELLAKVEADEPIEVPEEDVPRDCERTESLPSFSFQPADSLSLSLVRGRHPRGRRGDGAAEDAPRRPLGEGAAAQHLQRRDDHDRVVCASHDRGVQGEPLRDAPADAARQRRRHDLRRALCPSRHRLPGRHRRAGGRAVPAAARAPAR